MADLGSYSPAFLASWAEYGKAFRKINQVAIDYGVHARDLFMASSPGSKSIAYQAWQKRLEDTYCGAKIPEEVVGHAVTLLLLERLRIVKEQRKANLGHMSTELNKEQFNDFLEAAFEQAEQKRLAEEAN